MYSCTYVHRYEHTHTHQLHTYIFTEPECIGDRSYTSYLYTRPLGYTRSVRWLDGGLQWDLQQVAKINRSFSVIDAFAAIQTMLWPVKCGVWRFLLLFCFCNNNTPTPFFNLFKATGIDQRSQNEQLWEYFHFSKSFVIQAKSWLPSAETTAIINV